MKGVRREGKGSPPPCQVVRHDKEGFTPPGHIEMGVWRDEEGQNPPGLSRFRSSVPDISSVPQAFAFDDMSPYSPVALLICIF